MSSKMVLQTSVNQGHTVTEQSFGKPNSLPDATNEVVIVSSKSHSPDFSRIIIGSGGSPCWATIAMEKVVRVKQKERVTTRRTVDYITLDKAALLQLSDNLRAIANNLKDLQVVRPDLFNQIPSANGQAQ